MNTTRFPVEGRTAEGWLQRYAREGYEGGFSFNHSSNPGSPSFTNPVVRPTWTPGAFTEIFGSTTPLGRTRVVLEAHVVADQMCEVAVQYGQSQFAGAISETTTQFRICTGQNAATFDCQGGLLIPELGSFNMGVVAPFGNAPFVAGGGRYVDLTADFNWHAQHVVMFIGDSITYAQAAGANGTSGMKGNDGFPMRVRNHLLGKGVSVRHVNLGVSGMTSQQALIRLNNNTFYDCVTDTDKVALIVEMMGMNDAPTAAGPTSQGAFNNYLDAVKAKRDRVYPNADILCVGPTSTNDSGSGRAANIANYRTWKSTWVTANAGDPASIFYVDGSTAYGTSGGDLSTYFGESSSQIHPNIAGHAAIESVIGNAIASTRWGRIVLPNGY